MTRTAWLVVVALAPMGAHAQLFKCTGPDGKVVYSDTRCEGSDKGNLKVTPMGTTPSEREKAMAAEKAAAEAEAARRAAAEGRPLPADASASARASARYELTASDKDRIRELEITMGSLGASREQKEAAGFEISSIRSGADSRLNADSRSRRDSLRTDLSSADAKKRRQALEEFRRVYY